MIVAILMLFFYLAIVIAGEPGTKGKSRDEQDRELDFQTNISLTLKDRQYLRIVYIY